MNNPALQLAAPHAGFSVRPVRFPQAWAFMQRTLAARRTRRVLAQLDDHILADIGMCRGDILRAPNAVLLQSDLLR